MECSDRIKFEELNLPVDKNAFQTWVKKHFKILSSLMPLNLFCKTLPRELFLQELTDFLFDHRVALAFAHYRDTSSKIISGDMADLVCDVPVQDNQYPCVIDIKAGESLLEMEKTKSKIAGFESPVELFCSDNCLQPSSRLNFVYG
ncbi:hypothetical protein [Desulfobacula toluolica]|uniref:Uncharacterized protein n=1 Tax=Desulfobacula toluolica (strain DSM 7467 / Tol2) TaxID=651182 RepID=K0NFW5_DESTT|nr:hypothetical protein [Desulfobacula toluolica]CCK79840.1 uncharacterized protein TOL2_C16790 [Desulfobacula toluolica Tol2]